MVFGFGKVLVFQARPGLPGRGPSVLQSIHNAHMGLSQLMTPLRWYGHGSLAELTPRASARLEAARYGIEAALRALKTMPVGPEQVTAWEHAHHHATGFANLLETMPVRVRELGTLSPHDVPLARPLPGRSMVEVREHALRAAVEVRPGVGTYFVNGEHGRFPLQRVEKGLVGHASVESQRQRLIELEQYQVPGHAELTQLAAQLSTATRAGLNESRGGMGPWLPRGL